MVKRWREVLENSGETGAVLTDIFKAFDCINHNLLVAKLKAHCVEKSSLDFIHCYLFGKDTNRVIF